MLSVYLTPGVCALNYKCKACGNAAKWTVKSSRSNKIFDSCSKCLDTVLTVALVEDRQA